MADKIRVLMVGPDRSVHGGISAVVNELYGAGLDKLVELKYLGTVKEGSKCKKLIVAAFAYARFLYEIPKCDIVHIHFSSDSSFVRKAFFIKSAYRHKKKIVLHQHGGDFKTYYGKQLGKRGKNRVRHILDMADVFLVLTESWKEYFSNIISSDKIKVFPNGVSTVDYTGIAGNKSESNIVKDYNKVVFLGRICKDKGMDELLEAMDDIHTEIPEAELCIGGIYEDESYRAKINSRKDYVHFLGWISGEEKKRLLEKCGILVLPSYFEGFGMVIIEAMLKKCAVIATSVGGIPEIIDDGIDGVLVPPRNHMAISNAIKEVMCKHDYAISLGEKGKDKVLKNFSVEENVKKLEEIYKKTVTKQ